MMKNLFLPILLLASLVSQAQVHTVRTDGKVTPVDFDGSFRYSLKIPVVSDTTSALSHGGLDSLGLIIQIRSTGVQYKRDTFPGGHKWTIIGSGGGSSFDSSASQGGGFHTQPYNDARYRALLDTLYAHYLMTRDWAYKMRDSTAAVTNAALAGKQPTGNYITSLTNDVTATGAGAAVATIAANAVTNAKAAQMGARTVKANITGSTANPVDVPIDSLSSHITPDSVRIYRKPGSDSVFFCVTPISTGVEKCVFQYRDSIGTGGGSSFDSLISQGGIFHTGNYNDSRYRQTLDTLFAHLLMTRAWGYKISDSLAADYILRIALKRDITDTSFAHLLMTRAWGYKISDSIFTVVNTALAGKMTNSLSPGHIHIGNNAGVAVDSFMVNDVYSLPECNVYMFAQGLGSSNNVTNYTATSIDSVTYYFSTTPNGTGGTDYGGWLAPSTSGDSVQVSTPFGIVIGDSQAKGTPGRNGREDPTNSHSGFVYSYPDSTGQLSYEFRRLTNMRYYNGGIGSTTTTNIRGRFMRDALGQNSFVNDGRPNQTLLAKPQVVVIVAGINDYPSVPASVTLTNLEWMAATCQEYGVKCVILNLPGDAVMTQAFNIFINTVNAGLKSEAFSQYGAAIVDYNSFWNDPTYGNDNIHYKTAYINSGDGIHPTMTGYDSLANFIFRSANLPVLSNVIFETSLSPTSPIANYNRPTGVTINGTAYTLPNAAFDTIPITSYVGDSVWIKITSSVNVVGTSTQTGFPTIIWNFKNNAAGGKYYTRRTGSVGAMKTDMSANSLALVAPDYFKEPILVIKYPPTGLAGVDGGDAFRVSVKGAAKVIVNGLTNTTALNNSTFSVYGSLSAQLASQISNLMIGNTSTAGTGYGLGLWSNGLHFEAGSTSSSQTPLFTFDKQGGLTPQATTANALIPVMLSNTGVGAIADKDTTASLAFLPTYNNTSTNNQPGFFGGIFIRPTITSLGLQKLFGIWQYQGDNWLNTVSGKTAIGTTAPKGSAKLDVSATKQGFLPPRMTSAQRDSIGYISAITVTAAGSGYSNTPTVAISGGTGSGAVVASGITSGGAVSSISVLNPGIGYAPGTPVTVTITGVGGGSGATATATISGADSGLIIFNTTIDSLQYWNGTVWVDIGAPSISTSGVQTIYSQNPASATPVSNTTTETSMVSAGTGSGSRTIGSGVITAGKTYRYRVVGYIGTVATPGNLTINLKLGGVTIASSTVNDLTGPLSGSSDYRFICEGNLTCLTSGSSGTILSDGTFAHSTGSGLPFNTFFLDNSGGTSTVNTTISNAFDLTATWATASSSNSIIAYTVTLEQLN